MPLKPRKASNRELLASPLKRGDRGSRSEIGTQYGVRNGEEGESGEEGWELPLHVLADLESVSSLEALSRQMAVLSGARAAGRESCDAMAQRACAWLRSTPVVASVTTSSPTYILHRLRYAMHTHHRPANAAVMIAHTLYGNYATSGG
eukprot:1082405-Pleurochrysis_carterae.AAC.6